MLIYLLIGQRAVGRALLGPLWTRTVREGIWAGLLGAAAVAIWFLAYDAVAGLPLRTPALLGAALFHGLRDPAPCCSPRGTNPRWRWATARSMAI